MTTNFARAVFVSACLCVSSAAQAPAPQLSKDQRTLLQTLVLAVDAAAAQPPTSDVSWLTHVMRASDGSHYVAFSVEPPATLPMPDGPVVLYLRLATAASSPTQPVERSAIREWLAGSAVAPPPISRRGIAIGEMPTMGATGNFEKCPPTTQGQTDLQLMALERRRERESQDAREKQRRAGLEGKALIASELMPFEDFDMASLSVAADGVRKIERALTAGPGNYALYVAWANPADPNPATTLRVMKKSLMLPAAATDDLTISSVILADDVRLRDAPYHPSEQASHPYSLGVTEIAPAPDSVFRSDENLSLIFQVINPRPSETGKPDLEIAYRVVRLTADREQPVASLTPQHYSGSTLPDAFDLRVGHPLLASVSAPLETLNRGSYRLKISVNDRIAGRATSADVDFSVAATAASLLKEAPAPAAPFRRESILDTDVLAYLVESLRPASPSQTLRRALDAMAAGRFVDLLVEAPVAANEEGVRVVLTGLALFAAGDAASGVQFQRAQLLGAPIAPARLLAGAARAMQGRDPDAIAAWREAVAAGVPRAVIAPFLLDAYLRRSDYERAVSLVAETTEPPPAASWTRAVAATHIATQKEQEAITLLDAHLGLQPEDAEARWLLLHALYASFVRSTDSPDAASVRARFIPLARAYIDAGGAHAALATEWLRVVDMKR